MRKFLLPVIVLISAVAFGQVRVQSGHVTYWTPGAYAGPFEPLVVTPSVSLEQYSPSPVGASNATAGNVAGAANSTLSLTAPLNGAVVSRAVWYGEAAPESEVLMPHMHGWRERGSGAGFGFGSAQLSNSVGLATLISEGYGGPARVKAAKVYTNQDVDAAREKVEQNVGTVKYDGKTERLQ
jgi:hypothetical protein